MAKDKMIFTVLYHLVIIRQREGQKEGRERNFIRWLQGVRYLPIYYPTNKGVGIVLSITPPKNEM